MKFNKFKWMYKTVKIFIFLILFAMTLCLIISFIIQENAFFSSLFLNIFGGLSTGLLLIFYQYYREKKLKKIKEILSELSKIKKLSTITASKEDFCNSYSEQEVEEFPEKIDVYALKKYDSFLHKVSKEFNKIEYFSKNVLTLDLNFDLCCKTIDDAINYFTQYRVESILRPKPYLVYGAIDAEGYPKITDVISYGEKGYPDNYNEFYQIEAVLLNNNDEYEEFDMKNDYILWVELMQNVISVINEFNSNFQNEKKKIMKFHSNSKII